VVEELAATVVEVASTEVAAGTDGACPLAAPDPAAANPPPTAK
jgi:hypothetical protein